VKLARYAAFLARINAGEEQSDVLDVLLSQWKNSILYHEELVLATTNFDLEVDLPSTHLQGMLTSLGLDYNLEEKGIAQSAQYIINDW
jgi:hypothetical protein